MIEYYITTKDNPYVPYEDFNKWYMEDIRLGYYTSAMLARISMISDAMTDYEYNQETSRAIDTIIDLHDGVPYVKLAREVPDDIPLGVAL
jgi:hypothetical protein